MNQTSKYILYVSVALNGILLMTVAGVIPFLLYLSVVINLVLTWFCVKCLRDNDEIEEDLSTITNKTDDFTEHLENVHGMEMFYGDETLQGLIQHSKELVNDYIDLQAKYFDVEVIIEEEEEEEEEEDAYNTTEETPSAQAQE